MKYNLVPNHDPILSTPTEYFDFDNPPVDPVELFENMKVTMLYEKGVGLAAPQVGLPYSMFVFGYMDDDKSITAVFNPKIVDISNDDVLAEEGCLSYPGIFLQVKRPSSCRVRFADQNGDIQTKLLSGYEARAFLHEYDHILGKTFISKVSSVKLDRARKEKKKLDKIRKKNRSVVKKSLTKGKN